MADQTNIIELTIDLSKAVKDTTDYQIRVDELKRSLDMLVASEEATGEEIAKATAEYKSAKDQLTANEKVLKQLTTAEKEEAGTLEKLTARNNQLRLERNKLNLTTEEGKKRLSEINTELDNNNKFIKENSDKQKQQNLNVGNYGSALDGVTDKLSAIPGPAGGVISSFVTLTKAAWAFVATPVGAIVAAIVLGFTMLYNVFKTFQPLVDKIEQGFAALGAVINVLKDGVLSLFTGQKSLSESFKDLGENMSKAAKEAIALKKAEQDLDDMNMLLIESNAKSKRQIDELLLQSKDRTKSEQERIDLIDQALKLEEEAYAKRKAVADKEYEIALGKITVGRNLTDEQIKQLREVGVQAALNLQDTKALTDEEVKVFAEAIATREQVLNESISIREKAINRQNALIEKAEEEEQKRIEKTKEANEKAAADRKKLAEEEEKRREKEAAAKLKAAQESITALEQEVETYRLTNQSKFDSAKWLTQELVDEEKKRNETLLAKDQEVLKQKFDKGLITLGEYNLQKLQLETDFRSAQNAIDQEWDDIRMNDAITAAQMRYDAERAILADNIFATLELERKGLAEKERQELELIDKLAIDHEQAEALKLKVSQKYAKADAAIDKAKNKAKLSLASDFADNIATIAGEGTAVGKAAAVAAATINTYQAATGAYASLAPIPIVGPGLGIVAAAAAVAAGIANVKKILSVKSGLPGDDSSGSASIDSSAASGSAAIQLPTATSPTIGQGIVSRETSDMSAGIIKQGFSEALQENPLQPTLVVDQVTASQNQQSRNNQTATL